MASGNVPREIYIFGIILFYLFFGLLYLALGNTLYEVNQTNLPSTLNGTYQIKCVDLDFNPFDEKDCTSYTETNSLLSKINHGIDGYDTKYEWINYIFIIFTALIIIMIITLLLHG